MGIIMSLKYIVGLVTAIVAAGMIALLSCGVFSQQTSAANYIGPEHRLKYVPAPAGNPLKGLVSWESLSPLVFPHSLEYYPIPLKAVQTGYTTFDWTSLETALNKAKANGNQAIIRFYVDNPDEETALPRFLFDDGLKVFPYIYPGSTKTCLCPDYTDTKLQTAFVNFIKAFGVAYDGDSRIATIQAGLLGFWGEWHTTGHPDWYPSAQVYELIASTYVSSFHRTDIGIREPKTPAFSKYPVGYFDDMFMTDTKGFIKTLKSYGLSTIWSTHLIGGELDPSLQSTYFNSSGSVNKWTVLAAPAHVSYILDAEVESYSGAAKSNAIAAAKALGYNLYVTKVYYPDILNDSTLIVGVEFKNVGTAPFYYPWDVQLVLVDAISGETVTQNSTGWSLPSILPDGKTHQYQFTMSDLKLIDGRSYLIKLKAVNPMEGGKILRFSNDSQGDDGWLVLGETKH